MECERSQTEILTSLDEGTAAARDVEAHLADCPACARFAAAQRSIHARLAATLVTPPRSGDLRRSLRARIARDQMPAWRDALPDIVHFASWGAATLLSILVLPLNASVVLAGGATAALLAYVALTVARTSLEDHETRLF
jgi:anti-sigma factor RsiW